MDIVNIARKLEPLIPKQIGRLLQSRELADPEMQHLIDTQIITLARKRLGDYHNKLLLSLPPDSKARGAFELGKIVYEKEKWRVGIPHSELLQNLAIFGRSGSGKTNCTFLLLEQLVEKRIPFLYLDWKRTARHMLPRLPKKINVYTLGRSISPFPFNPFIPPPGLEKHLYVNHVVDIFATAYTLGDGAKSILQKAISICYKNQDAWPSIQDVLTAVEGMETKERASGWKISTIRALESLASAQITDSDQKSQKALVENLCYSNTILETDGLTQGAKKFMIPLLCSWIYYYRLAQSDREELRLVVFVEEAHHVFYGQEHRAKESLMDMLMRQCREVGIALVVVDQHPHLISSAALGNTYTTICLNLKDPVDINKASGLCLLDEEDKKHLSMLPVGLGIVKLQDRWRRPFLVRFPLMNIQKGLVSDEMIEGYSVDASTGSGLTGSRVAKINGFQRIPIGDKALEHDALALIEDVLTHKDDGVKVRYERLGLRSETGTRIKEQLIGRGWLEGHVVPIGRTRKLILRLTKDAREALGLGVGGNGRESLVHEYWKRWYARRFKEQGYHVETEAQRVGGRVDVLATKEGQRIGIEIETGKSDAVSNVRNGLREGFDKVVLIAVNKSALRNVEARLLKADLLIPNRVSLTLTDQPTDIRFR